MADEPSGWRSERQPDGTWSAPEPIRTPADRVRITGERLSWNLWCPCGEKWEPGKERCPTCGHCWDAKGVPVLGRPVRIKNVRGAPCEVTGNTLYSTADPTMPRRMPYRVQRELTELLSWAKVKPAPIDIYLKVRDALIADAIDPMPEPERKSGTWHKTPEPR